MALSIINFHTLGFTEQIIIITSILFAYIVCSNYNSYIYFYIYSDVKHFNTYRYNTILIEP